MIYLALFLFLQAAAGEVVNRDIWLATSNLLVNPPTLVKCIYTSQLLQDLGAADKNGKRTPLYQVNHVRVGYNVHDFYVLMFRDRDETTNCANATEGHGLYGDFLWRFGGGIVLTETNDAAENTPKAAGVQGWRNLASEPLKMGMPPLKLHTVHFVSADRFEADDFLGNKLVGTLLADQAGQSNSCVISFVIGDLTNINRTTTVIWPSYAAFSSQRKFPARMITRAEGMITSDIEVQDVSLLEDNSTPNFSPEEIADCKLMVLARGTVAGDKTRVVDLSGKALPTVTSLGQPNKRWVVFVILIAFTAACALIAAMRRKNKRQ